MMFTDFNKLYSFVEVAEAESISKAANNLFRTQSAITQQIQSLEEELGLALLERKNARIYLTCEGEKIYHIAKDRLREISEGLHSVIGDTQSIGGTIRIGMRADLSRHVFPKIATSFKARYPNVNFQISHGIAREIEQLLSLNKIDVGIQLVRHDTNLFDYIPTKAVKLLLVASAEYIKQSPNIRKPSDILDHAFIDYTSDNEAMYNWAKKADSTIASDLKRKNAVLVCDESTIAHAMVRNHSGLCILPDYIVEQELNDGSLTHVLPNKACDYQMSFDIVIKKKRSEVLIKEAFLKHIQAELC
ncbi:MAG: DNA-binding transcriptional LysR family regulator [Flavobacteriales bacterium]|jgi:DNA-binding transcriptional LysR family regulator